MFCYVLFYYYFSEISVWGVFNMLGDGCSLWAVGMGSSLSHANGQCTAYKRSE